MKLEINDIYLVLFYLSILIFIIFKFVFDEDFGE